MAAKIALLFPGQGSQRVGMGKELALRFPLARQTFEEADEALGEKLSTLCWEGPEAELTLTASTQPAILANSIAVWRVLRDKGLGVAPAAGHSLGEWSALVSAGAIGFADAVRLVRLRGQAMQDAVPAGVGGMAAIMGLAEAEVDAVCKQAEAGDEVVRPANLNGAGQIVISGHAAAVERAIVLAKAQGARRAIALAVSAPFHSPLMQPAAIKLGVALAEATINAPLTPVVANCDGQPYGDAASVRRKLEAQVCAPVRWSACVEWLAGQQVTRGLELGSGAVLAGLVKRIAPAIRMTTIGEPHEVDGFDGGSL
jgi:[acyl-carrier-protein] S-malonyltransferase